MLYVLNNVFLDIFLKTYVSITDIKTIKKIDTGSKKKEHDIFMMLER